MADDTLQHHPFSASGAEGWKKCSGKLVMERGIPEKPSMAADEGSAAHYLAAYCLTHNSPPSWFSGMEIVCYELDGERDGQCFSQESLPFGAKTRSIWNVNQEMIEHVTGYVNFLLKLGKKGGTMLVEQRVHFGGSIGAEGAFGTSDAIILSEDGTELTIVDLKYGYKEVSANRNAQMMLYAIGALETFSEAKSLDDESIDLILESDNLFLLDMEDEINLEDLI